MKNELTKSHNTGLTKTDILKIFFVIVGITFGSFMLSRTGNLGTAFLLSFVFSILLSPWVSALERRGYKRGLALLIVFGVITAILGSLGYWAVSSLIDQWDAFSQSAPKYFDNTLHRLQDYEAELKTQYSVLRPLHTVKWLEALKKDTTQWFLSNGADVLGDLLTLLLLVPIVTIVMLKDGRGLRKRFYELVPNRFFETTFMVSHRISSSLGDYIRAKIIEAFLVGFITSIGLAAFHAPYALVLGVIASITNIIPYVGPVIGAVPGILMIAADPAHQHLLWPVVCVYLAANVIDTIVIFPLLVAKLVNLHPIILIAVVMVGQQYYGLIGMLISIPIATALKVIIQEIYYFVYGNRSIPHSE